MSAVSCSEKIPFALPVDHAALEGEIRVIQALQDPFMLRIEEKRLTEIFQKVIPLVVCSLVSAAKMRPFLQADSIALAARMITLDKDERDHRADTENELLRVVKKLSMTNIGKECMLRVIHAISTLAMKNLIPFPDPKPTLSETYVAAAIFAAEPLEGEIEKIEAYRESLAAEIADAPRKAPAGSS